MTITLSALDRDGLNEALRLLLSPLVFPSVDAWRSAVNAKLRGLLNADSAGFLLTSAGSLAMYSDEHDPTALAKYTDFVPPTAEGGLPVYQRIAQCGAATIRDAYGSAYRQYLKSPYFNEYAAPNRAFDTLSAVTAPMPDGLGGLHFWHSRRTGSRFSRRDAAMLKLALPALEAGVRMHVGLGEHCSSLMRVIDDLASAVVVFDTAGRLLHQSAAATQLLANDIESETVFGGMVDAVRRRHATVVIHTKRASYTLRRAYYDLQGRRDVQVIGIERSQTPRELDGVLSARFGLTPAESVVTNLIAKGKDSYDIGQELSVSVHTVKRHTESIFRKLRIDRRAQIAPLLASL